MAEHCVTTDASQGRPAANSVIVGKPRTRIRTGEYAHQMSLSYFLIDPVTASSSDELRAGCDTVASIEDDVEFGAHC